MSKLLIGYQVFSARDAAEKDLYGTLKALKDMGYDGVELAGLYGKTPEAWRAMLNEIGLRAISCHVSFDQIEANPFKVIADYKTIGCDYIAVPYLPGEMQPGKTEFAKTIRKIRRFGELCKDAKMQLLYHNHDFEFVEVSGQYGLDFLYDAICPCALQTEIDTCWAKYAGVDPAAYIRKYSGRAPLVHLKDYVGRRGGQTPYGLINAEGKTDVNNENIAFQFQPIGHGSQDIPAIVRAAVESGTQWFIVEQDESTERAPLEDAKLSREFLTSIGQ